MEIEQEEITLSCLCDLKAEDGSPSVRVKVMWIKEGEAGVAYEEGKGTYAVVAIERLTLISKPDYSNLFGKQVTKLTDEELRVEIEKLQADRKGEDKGKEVKLTRMLQKLKPEQLEEFKKMAQEAEEGK